MVCSSFWKLDKIDKIGISIILVFFTLFSIFNTVSFGATSFVNVPVFTISDTNINPFGNTISNNSSSDLLYFPIEENTDYTISFNTISGANLSFQSVYYGFVNILSDGTQVNNVKTVSLNNINTSYSFNVNTSDVDFEYFVISINRNHVDKNTVTVKKSVDIVTSGYSSALTSLSNSVGVSELWSTFENSLPFALVVVLFTFGFFIFAYLLKKLSKGRGY